MFRLSTLYIVNDFPSNCHLTQLRSVPASMELVGALGAVPKGRDAALVHVEIRQPPPAQCAEVIALCACAVCAGDAPARGSPAAAPPAPTASGLLHLIGLPPRDICTRCRTWSCMLAICVLMRSSRVASLRPRATLSGERHGCDSGSLLECHQGCW
jgi:hypothetical protein